MQVTRWGDGLAVRLPAAIVDALFLKEGDDIELRVLDDRTLAIDADRKRLAALERIRKLRRKLPPGWVFDRDEANAR